MSPILRAPAGLGRTELMVLIGVIAVGASALYAHYEDRVMRGRRADGHRALVATAEELRACRAALGRYGDGRCAAAAEVTGGRGRRSPGGLYSVTAADGWLPGDGFTLEASPAFPDPACGTLTLDEAGRRGRSGAAPLERCW